MPIKGIPDKEEYGDFNKLPINKLLDYILQKHDAVRAKTHYDLRFGNPETGLYSWAVRKGMPEPSKKHLAVLQPLHEHSYKDFQGKIEKGYGQGDIAIKDKGTVLITKVEPDKINFTLMHKRYPERFSLLKPKGFGKDKDWLLLNTTLTKALPYEKIHYKSVPASKIEPLLDKLQQGSSVSAKIDGSASLAHILKDKIELLSLRRSKVNERPIVHTERTFHTIPQIEVPKKYVGSVLRGELYGQQHNKPLPPQALGAVLNATPENSLKKQTINDIKLKNLVFDIHQEGKTPISLDTPYEERMNKIKNILAVITGRDSQKIQEIFHTPEEAKIPEEAKKLYKDITTGKHPATTEGIVIHPPTGKPIKSKLVEDHDVLIRGIFPGKGKYTTGYAGGFYYSDPGKPDKILGKIGGGFTDEARRDLFENQQEYIGRLAKVRATRKLPNGNLFQPTFLSYHEG